MEFYEVLDRVANLLQQRRRVSYRALKLQFALDDATLDAVKAELIEAQQLARDEQGTVLVWTGADVTGPVLTPTPAPAPLTYTPSHLAEKILTVRRELEGEQKQVTVLLVHVHSSLQGPMERHLPETRALLAPVVDSLLAAIHRFEGTVTQVREEGVMALFGAPLAHEDHAVRACYTALAMQEAVRSYSTEVRRSHGIEVQIRVGLHTGDVVVHTIDDNLQMDYAAIGHTTHLATRLGQVTPLGSIRLTAETLRLVEGLVQVTPLGAMPLPGMPGPVEVFELTGAGATRRRLQATAARGLTPFVGRQHELEVLRQALEQAGAGHGQVAALLGEAGVGKSRLVYEFLHSYRPQDWLILESSSVSYGKATPYFPVIDLLQGYFRIEARDAGRRIREKVTGKLLTLDPTLGPTLPAFLALLDARLADPQWQARDPSQRRQDILEAIKSLLLRESQEQPVLLVFEDLHWIDTETQTLLDILVESLSGVRLLLLVNYRPEYQHPWGSKASYTQLRLEPLPEASVEALLHAFLGVDGSLAPLTSLLMARTGGNPFFLEESVRTLVETQVLVGARGAYRLAQGVPSIQVPTTVQAVLAARLDRLPAAAKRLLQTAAVIGTEVPFTLLQAIAELPEQALQRSLMHLQATAFLYEATLFPALEYHFAHALTHEVTYGSLAHERRHALHAGIVQTLEALAPERLADQVERLAQHAFRGEVWDKALHYCRQAGVRATERSAFQEAAVAFEQALVALQHIPDTPATRQQAIDLCFNLRYALVPLGEQGKILNHLRQAAALAEALGDRRRLGQIAVYLGACLLQLGDPEAGLVSTQQALALATSLADVGLQINAQTITGEIYLWALSDYRQTVAWFTRNVEGLSDMLPQERFGGATVQAVSSRANLAWGLGELGAFREAQRHGEDALRLVAAVDHPYSLARACVAVGHCYLCQGAIAPAVRLLEQGLEISEALHFTATIRLCSGRLGAAYALSGRVTEALLLLDRAMEQLVALQYTILYPLYAIWLGEGYILTGHVTEAMGLGQRALELTRTHKQWGYQADALRLLGASAAAGESPDVELAATHYHQALALAEALGMRPLQAHCHRGLGMLYAQAGQQEQARAALSTAIGLYRAMAMRFWLPQTEAALATVI